MILTINMRNTTNAATSDWNLLFTQSTVVFYSMEDKHRQWTIMSFMNEIIIRCSVRPRGRTGSSSGPPSPSMLNRLSALTYPRHFRWCHFSSFVILWIFNVDRWHSERSQERRRRRDVKRCGGESELNQCPIAFQDYEVTGCWLPHEESLW